MMTKESLIKTIVLNNHEIEILNKFRMILESEINGYEPLVQKMFKYSYQLEELKVKFAGYKTFHKYLDLYLYKADKDINSTDIRIFVERKRVNIYKLHEIHDYSAITKEESKKWESVTEIIEERFRFVQATLEELKTQNNDLKKALSDLDSGRSIEEVESSLLKSKKTRNNDKKLEHEARLKELGYKNLELLCDSVAKKHGLVKHEKISEDDIKKVYDEITKLGIETTLGSVTTTLRKKCGYSKSRKKENPEVK